MTMDLTRTPNPRWNGARLKPVINLLPTRIRGGRFDQENWYCAMTGFESVSSRILYLKFNFGRAKVIVSRVYETYNNIRERKIL